MKRNKKGQFSKGTNGNTFENFGIWYDKKGYPCIWINRKNIKLHIYIWERNNGSKPKGHDIHHKDFNKKNYQLDNLELLTKSDHLRIHNGWVRENGKWILKPCKDCKKLLPLNDFYQRKGLTPSNHCRKCSVTLFQQRNTLEYRTKRKIYIRKYYLAHKDKWKNYAKSS